ncbi:hypothetical protein [Bacteroides sp.]
MMRKQILMAGGLALLLAACTNETLDEVTPQPEQEAVVFDLNALNYEDVMTRLSESAQLKGVSFKDGEVVKTISELTASDNLDPDQAETLVFNSANAEDSLDMTVTPDFITVRSTVDGQMMAYIAYADGTFQKQLADFYTEIAPVATRSGEAVVTRGADDASLKLNLTAIREGMQAEHEQTQTYSLTATPPVLREGAATRGFFSNLFKKVAAVFKPAPAPVVKKATVDIYLLREKGSNPVTHEMNWQVNDAISSLKDVYGNVNFNVHIADCDFRGNNDGVQTKDNFANWVKKSSYKNTNGVFILCRWGGWKDLLGRARVDAYNVNNSMNREAIGISATNAWNKFTMAHEIGHIFGAQHVSVKWWQVFWSSDLMSANSYDWLSSGKHKDDTNRNKIKANLTLR